MKNKLILCFMIFFLSPFKIYGNDNIIFKRITSIEKGEKKKISPQDKLGIKVESIRLTAYGKLVDFRYRVLDEKKAGIIFNPKINAFLVDTKTGNKFHVPNTPKVGSLRSYGTPMKNRVYFMLFGNNGELKKGSVVNVVIGDTTIENLVIE